MSKQSTNIISNCIEKTILASQRKKKKNKNKIDEAYDVLDETIMGESIAPGKDDCFTFDRFMNEITESELASKKSPEIDETPQRLHAKRYREHWMNRTRCGDR